MVSKPNPHQDEVIRARLYQSYQLQMPMWDYPGDFCVGETTGTGCYNCNGAFKLGSGRMRAPLNAYAQPESFFYLPVNSGGRKPKRPHYHEQKQEADSDWYSI